VSESARALDVLVVAGEASGDQRAARLLAELRHAHPAVRAFGLGGDALRAAGCETLADSREIAVVGLVEVLRILRRARAIFRQLLDEVDRRGARTAILVDSPDFNLRLARELRRRGVRVVYYVSPQLWAWRKGRIHAIRRDVDLMLALFPFEVDFYHQHGVDAVHVGHPLVDEIPRLPQAWDGPAEGPMRLALLPGSRRSEVGTLLPRMLEATALLARRLPVHARLIQAPSVDASYFDAIVAASPVGREGLALERVEGDGRLAALADSHLALCASGTATLETGLLGTPLIALYRLNPLSYWLARWLVQLPHFCIVNLVLESRVVPELLQGETQGSPLADAAQALLKDKGRIEAQRRELANLRQVLGPAGASARAAAIVAERWRGWGLL
jgi:lipid-A-disaccharide synthase